MKVVFMGTPDFAVPSLDILIKEGYEVEAVVTQPDKPKGRGKKITPPPVKLRALQDNIPVLQPERIKTPEFESQIKQYSPDLIVVVAYGKILPRNILDIPALGCINVHASLLPRYRGAAPINWAIINGEEVTGVTTMLMDAGMDTGDILLMDEIGIDPDMTAGELHDILAEIGARLLSQTLEKLRKGELKPVKQDDSKASYAPMLDKDLGRINWEEPAIKIHNLVRGTNPWPCAFTYYKGKRMKIWTTRPVTLEERAGLIAGEGNGRIPGRIVKASPDGLYVECGEGIIRILNLQMENSRRMDVAECWHNMDEGEILQAFEK